MGETPPGCPLISSTVEAIGDVTAPVPHLGVAFSYAFTPTIAARLEVIGFAIELDNIDGSLIEFDADIGWNPWRHFGIGAGLRYFKVDVDANTTELNGEFKYEYFGPVVYIATTF
jgi:hypothetical protein